MNTHVANTLFALHQQAAGPGHVDYHFGWWALVSWASMFGFMALAKFADRFVGPAKGKGPMKSLRQLRSGSFALVVGASFIATTVACIVAACVTFMWLIYM